MKRIVTLLVGFIILLFVHSVHGQVESQELPEGYVPCSHEHTDPNEACYVKMPTEDEIRNHTVELRGNNSCRVRPLRMLIPYDREIENDYSPAEIDSMILQNASKLDTAFQNSNIEYAGIEYMTMPWDMPDYESIFDALNMLTTNNDGKLDDLVEYKNMLLDIDVLVLLTTGNTTGRGVATRSTSQYFKWENRYAVVNFGEVLLNSIVLVHEIGHILGGGHENGQTTGLDSNARAYVNDSLKTHSAVKAANILSREVPIFSGPNSWAYTQQGVYHRFYDTLTNNAYYVQLIHDEFMCANTSTYVEIDTPLCGNGQLRAITNNADSFIWQVVSGDIDLQTENDTLVDYLAHEESVVRVIAQKTGKLYADTAYMTVPARQEVVIDTMMTRGDTLSDGTVVDQSGTYLVTGLDENGCEVIYTYNVELSIATRTLQQVGISLYPNPTSNYIVINGLSDAERIEVINVNGKLLKEINNPSNRIDVWDIPNGLYIIKVFSKSEGLLTGKLIVDKQE